ncbi:CHASE2 domain-containing protein [uncultured Azonexus sp.]|uniref:CHASE2 domain-containing protein n=1 Tax=uncultured Azonexus sp. TaxID=520307 RepID=UPI0026018E9A|nr:adenylate/guanylate cyclase domain-containing protein [uncultured Azonexus sp.]
MKRLLPRLLFGVLCIASIFGHVIGNWQIPLLTLLDNYSYDVRTRAFMPDTLDERIVIVDIDEKSLGELGRWPWNRKVMSDLIRQLTDEYRVAVIGFDIVFAERDDSSGLPVLESLASGEFRNNVEFRRAVEAQRPLLDYDRIFAETLRERPTVLGFHFSERPGGSPGSALPPPQQFPAPLPAGQFPSWPGYGGNLAAFQEAAASGGHFNPKIDNDGIIRRVPLLAENDGKYYPALSLAMLQLLVGQGELHPYVPAPGEPVEAIDVIGLRGMVRLPVDGDGCALIPYRGREGSFPYVSAADVLAGRADFEQLFGRIVLIGTSAPGLKDLRATPVGGSYPGVETHANLLAGALDGSVKEKPYYMLAAEIVALILAGGILALSLPFMSPLRGTLLTLGIFGILVAANFALWQVHVVMPIASATLAILMIYVFNAAWGFFWESNAKRQFTALFGQYVPPELVDEMAKNPEEYSMEGRNADMSVLFSDVRNFTTISEGLPPRELSALMNEYLGAMTLIIQKHRGTLDKYIGDAIMAFWGAPVANPLHAREAVMTALEMQRRLRSLGETFAAKGWPVLKIGIGINSGTMTVGDMGSSVRKSYTVMGDAVNLGARLEGITKEYGVGIAVGEKTRDACPDIVFRELDKVRVKGKASAVSIYEPLGTTESVTPERMEELANWSQALTRYREQSWAAAETILRDLQRKAPDDMLYRVYLERIAHLRELPPGNSEWDEGVTSFNTKQAR